MTESPVAQAEAVAIARRWLGTPYHHQASLKGIGCDCLGLIRGIYRELYGRDVGSAANYSRDWAEASGIETMLYGAGQHLIAIDKAVAVGGDVIVFRLRHGTVAKHAALLTSASTMIHAMEGVSVSEVALSSWWRRRIAGAFRFPELT